MFISARRRLLGISICIYFPVDGKRAFKADVGSRLKMGWGFW